MLLLLCVGFYLGLCGALAWKTVCPKPFRMNYTPLKMSMAFEDVAFTSKDGTSLRGWVIPAASKPKGIVVCCHGVDSTRLDLLPTAATLHNAGYAVLLFDFRARGESGGSRCTLGYREVEDLLAAIRYARSRSDLQQVPLGLIGESMGGAVALMGAARCPDVRCVIAESPFARLDHAVSNHFHSVLGWGGPLLGVPTRLIGQALIGKNCADIAPLAEVARIAPRPLLLIEDGDDTLCPHAETQALYEVAGQSKSLWHVPHAAHIEAQVVAPGEYKRRITAFFNTSLAPLPRTRH